MCLLRLTLYDAELLREVNSVQFWHIRQNKMPGLLRAPYTYLGYSAMKAQFFSPPRKLFEKTKLYGMSSVTVHKAH